MNLTHSLHLDYTLGVGQHCEGPEDRRLRKHILYFYVLARNDYKHM